MDIKKLLEERNIELRYVNKNDFSELKDKTIITNEDNFTKNLLLNLGFKKFYTVREASVERADEIKKYLKREEIVGFGGGKAIDIAKKISFDLGTDLISIPTAPSHDGLISRNSSLYFRGQKKTIPTKYPKKLIIPVHLWKSSGDLKKAGICDLIANLVSLQDISLAEKNGEKFSEFYKKLSFEAAERVLDSKDEKELSEALIMSGIAMEESSVYCSESEHEVEKLFEKKGFPYLHGQLSGTGALISAKVYSLYYNKLPKLRFDSGKLFEIVKSRMKKKRVFKFALDPLFDKKFKPKMLKEVGKIRPGRYNLWNVIDPKKIDWGFIVSEILKD